MTYRSQRSEGIRFSAIEVRDLLAAWVALGVAFAVFFGGGGGAVGLTDAFLALLLVSLLTAGVGFLLHELAHKIVAIRFGQVAEFRANYAMLLFAIAAAFGGIIFAAPGAVYHRGRITERENGLISVAGPVTNIVLGFVFLPFLLASGGFLFQLGRYGVMINFFLAAFNMIPFGPLDGKKVLRWSKSVFLATFLASVVLTVGAVGVLLL